MPGHGRKDVDDLLAAELAAGKSIANAAFLAGCHERTVRRRLKDASFRAKVDALRAQLVSQAVGKLSHLGGLASDTLRDLLAAKSEAVRLGAARSILEHMYNGIEVDALARQFEDLKRQLEAMCNVPGNAPPRPDTPAAHDNRDDGSGDAGTDPGVDPPEPGPDPEPGRPDAGPVAI